MKKGFTLVELLISIGLFSIILVTTTSIFITAVKNYQISFQKNNFQKEINFTADDISKNIKAAAGFSAAHDTFNVVLTGNASNTLILEVPATTTSGLFVYDDAGLMQKDVIIYYLESGNLHKKIYANPAGMLTTQDTVLLNSIANTNSDPIFSYLPDLSTAKQAKIDLKLVKVIEKTNVRVAGSRIANIRN